MKYGSHILTLMLLSGVVLTAPTHAQTEPAKPEPTADKTAKTDTPAKSVAIMQLKVDLTGDFAYRFVAKSGEGAAPTPLPAATSGVVALPLPAAFKPDGATLEILDNGRGNLARLPVKTDGLTPLTEGSFKFVQVLYVPVQSKGKPVTDVQVTLTAKSASLRPCLLKSSDNGIARFENVPLEEPITLAVSYSTNPPKSLTETLPHTHPADGIHHEVINVEWPDVKTIAVPVVPPAAATTTPPAPGAAPATTPVPAEPPAGPGSNFAATILGIALIGGAGYGLFWAYTNGRLKPILDKMGIETGTLATQGATAANPFTNNAAKPAIQPITDGTADPFASGSAVVGGFGAPQAIGGGPRLVGTAGTYAGNIYPLDSPSVVIGRDASNPIALPDDTNVSRRHVTIQANGGQFLVVDNGSSNGTFVNGVKIMAQSPQPLRPGDELNIGNTRFRFEA